MIPHIRNTISQYHRSIGVMMGYECWCGGWYGLVVIISTATSVYIRVVLSGFNVLESCGLPTRQLRGKFEPLWTFAITSMATRAYVPE